MANFLLECRENEERQADLREGSSSILETTASFTNGAILTEI